MKERPIHFNSPMVRGVLSGQKTVTRRVMKNQPCRPPKLVENGGANFWANPLYIQGASMGSQMHVCPYGQPGDRLWVRETWADVNLQGAPGLAYRADGDVHDLMEDKSFLDDRGAFNYDDARTKPYQFSCWSEDLIAGTEGQWRPSIHMPRWASRILLEITDVWVERLQDISDKEIEAEGIDLDALADGQDRYDMCHAGSGADGRPTLRTAWRNLWESTGGDWDANPWVWVVEFKRVTS